MTEITSLAGEGVTEMTSLAGEGVTEMTSLAAEPPQEESTRLHETQTGPGMSPRNRCFTFHGHTFLDVV